MLYYIAGRNETSVSQEHQILLDSETKLYLGDGMNVEYRQCQNTSV